MDTLRIEISGIEEFIASCAKSFCPNCGGVLPQQMNGRPRKFCSDRCRWAYSKRKTRAAAKEKQSET